MYKEKKILAIIPARGGSKGLPRKNIRNLLGVPLLAWTIKQAMDCNYIDRVYVSTDSEEIAQVGREFGAQIPELRPKELAEDSSSTADLVNYIIDKLEKQGEAFDYIVLLEPTSPMRKKDDIGTALKLAIDHAEADGVVSVGAVHMENPVAVKKVLESGYITSYVKNPIKITQRQQMQEVYFPYGVAYVIKKDIFVEKQSFYTDKIIPYYIERWQNYEIDDKLDYNQIIFI